MTGDHKKCQLVCLLVWCYVCVCVCVAVVWVHPMYLFVCMVVGVDVVVKLLVSEVLLVTQLTIEKSLQILHWAAQSPLCTLLEKERHGENEWDRWREWGRQIIESQDGGINRQTLRVRGAEIESKRSGGRRVRRMADCYPFRANLHPGDISSNSLYMCSA